jgi:glycosyltransferase involved in cell wall biosynthesis
VRILNANKFFYPRGGSEAVMFLTRDLLIEHGHDVIDFSMADPANVPSPYASFFASARSYSSSGGQRKTQLLDAASSVYSPLARKKMRDLLAVARPDVAHLHNVYYQLTYSILDELYAQDIPVVMTLHDPHIGCPAHVLYRDGQECRRCLHGAALSAVRFRCVKGSAAASAFGAAEATLNRVSRKYRKIASFLCPSEYMAGVARDVGIPESRIEVIPNFLPDEETASPVTELESAPRFLFAGQLAEHKGVNDLLAAFERTGLSAGTLVLAGRGPLESAVAAAAARNPRIIYLGSVSRETVAAELRRCRAAILPSRWPENGPMSVLEARAAAVPVIGSDRGGLPEMIDHDIDGLIHGAGNVHELRVSIERLAKDAALATTLGHAGWERLQRDYGAARHYDSLMSCYEAAISSRRHRDD